MRHRSDVELSDIPSEQVVHCSDIQLGAPYANRERKLKADGWMYLIQYDAWFSPEAVDALYPTTKLAARTAEAC